MAVEMRAASKDAPATLALMGDVGWEITAGGVAAALKGVEPGAALTISLNSYGGDALAGIAIHNMLARRPGATTVIVEGVAASAASLIAMAGKRIVMPANAFLMIHEAWGLAMGDADTMRGQAELLDQISGAYRRTYAGRSGLAEDAVADLMRAETWMDGSAAKERGFADEVAEPAEVRASASRVLAHLRAVPEPLRVRAAATPSTPPAIPPASSQESQMADPNPAGNQPATPAPAVAAAPPVPAPSAPPAPAAATAEQVLTIAERNNLGLDFVRAQIAAGATREAALEAALDAVAARSPAPVATPGLQVTADAGEKFFACAVEAMTAHLRNRQPKAEGAELYGMGLHGMIREHAARAGQRNVHRWGNDQLADYVLRPQAGQHTTSDFAGVLANSTNKTLRELYGSYPMTWAGWTDEIEVDDFKTITAASIGQFPEPQVIAEGASVPAASIAEEWETYAVQERARLVTLSRRAIINDDLRAFQRVTQAAALGCYTALRRRVFGILTANGNLRDGTAIFAAGRANLGTAGALGAAQIRQLFQLHLQQTSPSRGPDAASAPLPPPNQVALLVPPEEAVTAAELTGPLIQPTAAGSALPSEYRQMIEVIPEGFLNTGNGPYYMARKDMRAMEIAYLRGRRTPTVTSAETIEHTGVTFRVLFDFEAAVVNPRLIAANLNV
jgi:ATP-dependent protease ClpP protease subunit